MEKIANFKNEIKIKQLILKIVKLLNCINEKLIILVINEYKNLSICYQSIIWNNKKKGKKALYLVLKRKPLIEEIIESVEEEVEKRFSEFINKKSEELSRLKPDNPEEFYKCVLLRALIKILDKMLEEYSVGLTDKDKNTLKDIFENDSFPKDELNDLNLNK